MHDNPAYEKHEVPDPFVAKWQAAIDTLARVLEVPAGLIMRVHATEIEVLISSQCDGNPYEPHEMANLETGLYCETVMASRSTLHVPNALEDPRVEGQSRRQAQHDLVPGHAPRLAGWERLRDHLCSRREDAALLCPVPRLAGPVQPGHRARFRSHRAHARTRAGPGRGGIREPGEERLPGEHESRDPNADERRIIGHDGPRPRRRSSRPPESARLPQHKIHTPPSGVLLTVINDILDFSKIEAGKLEIDPIDFGLRDSIAEMLSALAPRAHEKNLELACDIAPEVQDALIGDVHRLRQIIVNLVGNAIKFTTTGEIVVAVEQVDRTAETTECTSRFETPASASPKRSSSRSSSRSSRRMSRPPGNTAERGSGWRSPSTWPS